MAHSDFAALVKMLNPDATLRLAVPLGGGVSARTTALTYACPGEGDQTVVVRQHGERDRTANPRIAQDECRLLTVLESTPVPAPRCLWVDDACDPRFDPPALVIDLLPGQTDLGTLALSEALRQMAGALVQIHRVPTDGLDFLPRLEKEVTHRLGNPPAVMDEVLSESTIRAALAKVWPPFSKNAGVPTEEERLLHGDFWPRNLLWDQDRVSGVIDWEDAVLGDPLADVGNARLEILWAYGTEAMHDFTRQYAVCTGRGLARLPVWDLVAALRPAGRLSEWGLDPATERAMQSAHRRFVDSALQTLNLGR